MIQSRESPIDSRVDPTITGALATLLPLLFPPTLQRRHLQRLSRYAAVEERPLDCPRCQSHYVGPGGVYDDRPGSERYWCHGCRRTFNDLIYTLLAQSKRELGTGLLPSSSCACRVRRGALPELGLHISTSYRWRWWLRNAALSYEIRRRSEGDCRGGTSFITLLARRAKPSRVGRRRWGGRPRGRRKKREPGRGDYDKQRRAMIAWVSRQGGRRHTSD